MKIKLTNDELLTMVHKGLSNSASVTLPAQGSSMIPFIVEGRHQVVVGKVEPNSLKKGSIALVKLSDGRLVAHRVVRIENIGKGLHYTLRGDGNIYLKERVTKEDVVAEVVAVVRGGKRVDSGSMLWKLYRFLWPSTPIVRRIFLKIWHLCN
ncbi:MAG: S24/S26 family peptidase [Bacteroidales bacterium]